MEQSSLKTFSRPVCSQCKHNLAEKKKVEGQFYDRCTTCRRGYSKSSSRHYTQHKKKFCEECGFIAIHECQLDVDHKDGDKTKNEPEDLMTLCANCHRLKTYLEKDSVNISLRRNNG